MNAGLIALDFDILHTQASKVEQLGSDIGEASRAVQPMNLAGGAFGVLCNFLVLPAQVATSVAGTMIRDCEGVMQRAGSQLRKVTADAMEMEQAHIDLIRSIERDLG